MILRIMSNVKCYMYSILHGTIVKKKNKINLPSFKNLCPFIDGFRLVRFKLELQNVVIN